MPFDLTPFITPNPGPIRWSSPAGVSAFADARKQREVERSNAAQEKYQAGRAEAADAAMKAEQERLGAAAEWEKTKFREELAAKDLERTREIRSQWLGKVMLQDWPAANALAAELRMRGVDVEHVGDEQPLRVPASPAAPAAPAASPAPQRGAGGVKPKAGAKSPQPIEYDVPFGPVPGLHAQPARATPVQSPEAIQRSDRQRHVAAFREWEGTTVPGVPEPKAGPEEIAQEHSTRQAEKTAIDLWANGQAGMYNEPAPPVPGTMPWEAGSQERPGWVIRAHDGQELFRLPDEDVSYWRGQAIAQQFAPRMLEAKKPYERKAAAEGMRVAQAAADSGLPIDKALERGQAAYQFEIDKGVSMENAARMASGMAARWSGIKPHDPYEVRKAAIDDVRVSFKTSSLMDAQSTTQMFVKLLDEQGYDNGTLSNNALTMLIRTYDNKISDSDFMRAATATGLDSAIAQVKQYLTSSGRIPHGVMEQVHDELRSALEMYNTRLQEAGDAAENQVTGTWDLDPTIARSEGAQAALGVYPHWKPKSARSGGGRGSVSSGAAASFVVK